MTTVDEEREHGSPGRSARTAEPATIPVWPFARRLARRSLSEFFDDHCPQLAAGIGYHVLFSIFPLTIVLAAVFGLVVGAVGVRDDVIDTIVTAVPVSESGSNDLRQLLQGATSGLSALGFVALPGLIWSASGMMGATRLALNLAWDVTERRPFVRGKLLDVSLIMASGLLLLLAVGLTITARLAVDSLPGPLSFLGWVGSISVPLALAFANALFFYRVVPATETRFADIWPGAAFAAVGFTVLQNGFAVYVQHFGNYNLIYGSLGAVIAFMFFVYLAANVFLLGAEIAAEWPRTLEELRPRRSGGLRADAHETLTARSRSSEPR